MILKLLFNIQIILVILMKILKNTVQINKRKILIVFPDIIVDMLSNKKLNSIVNKIFLRGRKLSISLVFIAQAYCSVPKNIRLNSTH